MFIRFIVTIVSSCPSGIDDTLHQHGIYSASKTHSTVQYHNGNRLTKLTSELRIV